MNHDKGRPYDYQDRIVFWGFAIAAIAFVVLALGDLL